MLRNDLFRPWFVGENDWGFEIIDGEFRDVALQITKLEFGENEAGNLVLEYNVVHKPELISDEDLKGEKFEAIVELVINDILREAVQAHEQARDNDPQEPNPQ